ncbi:exonuclease [bacterium]|nr:exonuclease [bacterium]
MIGNKKTFVHDFIESKEISSTEIDGKRYYNVDGELYPSVTTVLSSYGKKGITEWRERVGEEAANKITRAAADRGTKVHNMCEDYVANKEDYKKGKMPTTIDLFNKIKPYLDDNLEKVYGIENGLYSKTLRAAGRCDLICRMHGVNCVVDYKTSTKLKKEEWIENYFLQETAYSIMINELYGMHIFYIITLIAVEEEPLQVFIKRPEDYRDKVYDLFNLYHLNN